MEWKAECSRPPIAIRLRNLSPRLTFRLKKAGRFGAGYAVYSDDESVMPDDVHPRYEWLIAFKKMGVRVFSDS